MLLPIILLGITFLIFAFMQAVNPYQRLFCFLPTNPSRLTKQQVELLMDKYHLRDPLMVQYISWLNQVLHGNLGWSQASHESVGKTIVKRFPVSAEIALYSFLPMIAIGIYLGIISSVNHNRAIDHFTRLAAITGWAFPTFVLGLTLLAIFYGASGLLPPGRLSTWASLIVHSEQFKTYTGLVTIDALLNGEWRVFLDGLRHLILPVLCLSVIEWALTLRVMRSSMLEVLRQDYITTARAKGLTERTVIMKHAVRNALLPTVTIAGQDLVFLFNGNVVVEVIFNYPGLGQWAADAALQLDVPAIIGFTIFAAVCVLIGNLVVDLLYAILDPRVKYD